MENPTDYTGFQVALWREIANNLGWADTDWTFSCVDWTAMIDDLVDPSGLCSFAAAGGTSAQQKRYQQPTHSQRIIVAHNTAAAA